jgi:hypothetical protein
VSARLLPLFCALALAGCGSTPRQSAAVGTPFTGTWHQAATTAANEPLGFLAIADDRVLFNLDGLPRGTVEISTNDTNAGLRSGRLVCADGRILYLAVGDSLATRESADGRLLTPTMHLDVHVFAAGAGAGDAPQKVLRLWPSAALAIAALPLPERTVAAAPAPTAAALPAKPTGSPADQRFAASLERLADPFLANIAERLTLARADGLPAAELDAIYRRTTAVVRGEILRDLDSARSGDRTALARADSRLDQISEADRAYLEWQDRR